MFKKITFSLAISLLGFSILTTPVFALSIEELLPADTGLVLKLDATKSPQLVRDYISGLYDFFPNNPVAVELADKASNKEITVTWGGEFFFEITGSFPLSEEEFQNDLKPLIEEAYFQETDYKGVTIYESVDFYIHFIYFEGQLIIGSQDVLKALIDRCNAISCNNNLAETNSYKTLIDKFKESAFLNLYMDSNKFLTLHGYEGVNSTGFNKLMSGLVVNVEANQNKEFIFSSYSPLDPKKLEELGLDFEEQTEVDMTQYLPNEEVIFLETSHVNSYFDKDVETDSYLVSNRELINLSLLPLFEHRHVMALQYGESVFPYFTYVGEILPEEQPELISNLEIMIDDIADDQEWKEEEVRVNGKNIKRIVTSYYQEQQNPYAPSFPKEFFEAQIVYGFTDNNLFVISTHPQIAEKFGEGISDSEIAELDSVDGLFYLSFAKFGDYIDGVLNKLAQYVSEDKVDMETLKDQAIKTLSYLGTVIGSSEITNSYIQSELKLTIDFEGLMEVGENLDVYPLWKEFKRIDRLNRGFNDLQAGAWYEDDIYYLAANGIFNGDVNGDFRPSDNINRAEFVTVLINALCEKICLDEASRGYSEIPKDIGYADWYYNAVVDAYELGLIEGYADGTFRPGQTITRAEAAQIMKNVYNRFKGHGEISAVIATPFADGYFADIAVNDWYHDAVRDIYNLGVMSGNGSEFAPARSINRAETAKVMRRFLERIE